MGLNLLVERRVKVGFVGREFLVGLFRREEPPPTFYSPEVPADAEVRGVEVDHMTDCFRVLFSHPSFPPVPEGVEPPRVAMKRRDTADADADDLLHAVIDKLTPPARQALYERLYAMYGCRVYRP